MFIAAAGGRRHGQAFAGLAQPHLCSFLWILGVFTAASLVGQAVNEFPLPGSRLAYGIATGPDGALWFADFLGRVGRITTGGVVSVEYTVPGNPEGIVAGPDGNLWFANLTNNINRITTAGVLTQFPVSGSTQRVTVGSDGALWFTEQSSNKIGRITTSGTLTEYPVPTSGTLYGIAAGSDGNLWFTEANASKIGRITTAGVITEFAIPTTVNTESEEIAAGFTWTRTAGFWPPEIETSPTPGSCEIFCAMRVSTMQIPRHTSLSRSMNGNTSGASRWYRRPRHRTTSKRPGP